MAEPTIQVFTNGVEWYLDGKLHRENGPAIEYDGGDETWINHGMVHRENGPARTWFGEPRWYLFEKQFTEEEFWKRVYHD